VFKQFQSAGLDNLYANDTEFALKIRMLPALSFVPTAQGLEYFDELVATLPDEAQPVVD